MPASLLANSARFHRWCFGGHRNLFLPQCSGKIVVASGYSLSIAWSGACSVTDKNRAWAPAKPCQWWGCSLRSLLQLVAPGSSGARGIMTPPDGWINRVVLLGSHLLWCPVAQGSKLAQRLLPAQGRWRKPDQTHPRNLARLALLCSSRCVVGQAVGRRASPDLCARRAASVRLPRTWSQLVVRDVAQNRHKPDPLQ